jgi:ADP-glucose pyrophosphorylase
MPDTSARFVSRLTRNTLALILAGGLGSRLKHLTKWCSKPAVPFGGKFRIVETAWYAGTADAVFQNLDIIRNHNPEYILTDGGVTLVTRETLNQEINYDR